MEEFRRDSNMSELAMVNEPSVFELLRFDCILFLISPFGGLGALGFWLWHDLDIFPYI